MKTKQINKIDWKEVELGSLGDMSAGGTPSRSKKEYWSNGKIPWLKISNLKNLYVKSYDEKITEQGLKNSSAKLFPKGTVLISIFASLGDVSILDIEATTNQAIAGIYNLNKSVDNVYLAYFLKSKKKDFERIGRGVAQRNLNLSILKKTKIFLPFLNGKPDLETQKAIVSILEKAEQLKEKRKKTLEFLDEYLKSVFNEMFLKKGFPEKELESITEIIMGQSPPGNSYNENGNGTPFFQGKAEFTEKYPIIKKWTTQPSKISEPSSILMSVRAPVGDVNINNIKSCIGRGLASIKPLKEIELYYLYYFLIFIKDKISNLGSGSTFKAITSKQLKSLKIHLPPIELQKKFAFIVEHVEKLKEKQKQSLEEIKQLNDVLMQKAFKGELLG